MPESRIRGTQCDCAAKKKIKGQKAKIKSQKFLSRAVGRLSLGRYGWRYWSFLVLKTIAVMVLVPLLWIETGTAMRAHLPSAPLRVLVGGLLFTMVFMAAFGCALLWSFADQRRRCPVCLQRLAMPVTMGSWASVFEPVTTELLCEEGHGSLSVPETEAGEPDRWTPLDASWRECLARVVPRLNFPQWDGRPLPPPDGCENIRLDD